MSKTIFITAEQVATSAAVNVFGPSMLAPRQETIRVLGPQSPLCQFP